MKITTICLKTEVHAQLNRGSDIFHTNKYPINTVPRLIRATWVKGGDLEPAR